MGNKIEEQKPWGFCETPDEGCTMNYCDENGCQNRERELIRDEPILKEQNKTEEKTIETNWDSPPMSTIKRILNKIGMSHEELRANLDMTNDEYKKLSSGELRLDNYLSAKLSIHLGGTRHFWKKRDVRYVEMRDKNRSNKETKRIDK